MHGHSLFVLGEDGGLGAGNLLDLVFLRLMLSHLLSKHLALVDGG